MSSSKTFQILFIVGSTFLIFIPECLNNFGGSRHHSQHVQTEEGFLLNLALFSSRFVVLACCHPIIIVFDCENLFHPSGVIQESSQFDYPEPIIEDLFILSLQLSFSDLTGASFKWSLIGSCSLRSHVSRLSHVSSFISLFFPVFLCLLLIHFQFVRWFVQEFSSFVITSIHSLFQSYRWFIEDLPKFMLYLS